MPATNLYHTTLAALELNTLLPDPRRVVVGADYLEELPRLLAPLLPPAGIVTILADDRTRPLAGDAILNALRCAGISASLVLLPDPAPGHDPICDTATYAALLPAFTGSAVAVAVGSGVVSDLTKWIAAELERPYLAVATAASMNGYASANVAPTIDGVKTLVRAEPPVAVLTSPTLLASAPARMTQSGLGDILAKSVSTMDWRLNHLLFGDEYLPTAAELIQKIEPLYLENPERLILGDADALAALFHGLLLTGVAMTLVGTSSPASGGEHLLSHTLDMMSALDGAPHDLHGRQVGLGTRICAELYEHLFALEAITPHPLPAEIDTIFWGPLAEKVGVYYQGKRDRLALLATRLENPATWSAIKEDLRPHHRPSIEIRHALAAAGGALTPADLGMTRERVRTALRHAHEIRSRITVIDLAWMAGILPQAVDELLP